MTVLLVAVWRGLGLAAAVVLAGVLLAAPVAAAKPTRCQIVDVSSHKHFVTLQTAVDAASPGDDLRVKGTCVGSTTITKDITIAGEDNRGLGAATLDGGNVGRVLTINAAVTVALTGLAVTHGTASYGGGIHNDGALTLVASAVTGNTAESYGGGISNGRFMQADRSAVTLVDSSVVGNTAGSDGGGIASIAGTLTLLDSTVSGNTAAGDGGGIHNGADGSDVDIRGDSAISGNRAGGDGGGIYVAHFGSLTVYDAGAISDNTATNNGGGLACADCGGVTLNDSSSVHHNMAAGDGGGIHMGGFGPLRMTGTSSVHHNMAAGDGGGLWLAGGGASLQDGSSITSNTPDNCFPPGTVAGCTDRS